jgi:hypothetical protein
MQFMIVVRLKHFEAEIIVVRNVDLALLEESTVRMGILASKRPHFLWRNSHQSERI